nr:UDP-N-acetylmuramoyl-L-alanine--D-glutamate ligase [Acidimicrobiia bacterium]
SFTGLAHRVALVAHVDQVRWIDDSKATNPHAAVNAIATFDSVVLIAGGRNKGLDLGVLADEGSRIRALIGIGEASPEVEAVAAALGKPFRAADSMDAAVKAAAALAKAGDTVLLSPACASFDWYRSYAERGNDFERAVQTWLLQPSPRGPEPGIASLEER